MSLAVFILPTGSLNDEIVSWKERIEKIIPNQPYALHPPHMTLINIEVMNEKEGIAAISAIDRRIIPFKISVNANDVFWDDIPTGGHTLYFGIKKNNSLFEIQKILAEALLPFKKRLIIPNHFKKNKLLLKSFEKYGFPFIGDHWMPHFSVASLQTDKKDSIITEFLSINKTYDFTVDQFSLWRIVGDDHIKVNTVNFQ